MNRRIRTILLLGLLLLLVFQMFRVCDRLKGFYPAVSLRYSKQISAEQVEQALAHAKRDSKVYPVFWLEESREVFTQLHSVQATAIGCYGEYSFAWPADFVAGAYPGDQQKNACTVSDTAAWKLWGSTDIVGQTLKIGEDQYIITGVFSSEKEMVVYSAALNAGFEAVELFGDYGGNECASALDFAQNSGLGIPNGIVYGPNMQWLARQAAMLPLYVSGLIFALRLFNRMHPNPVMRKSVWIILYFTFAALLPVILAALPNWLIPPAWSDFDFWSRLLHDARLRILEWLSMLPKMKDVEAKICLIQLFCMCGGTILIEVMLLFRTIGLIKPGMTVEKRVSN